MTRDDWLGNLWLILGLGFLVWLIVHGARSDRWRRAWLRLRRDRLGLIAGLVIALYLTLGALEMFRVPDRRRTLLQPARPAHARNPR